MKIVLKRMLVMIAIISSTTFLTNCDKTDDLKESGNGGSLTAKIDNVDFSSFSQSVGATVSNGILAVQGSTTDGNQVIRLNVSGYSKDKTEYDLGGFTNTNMGTYIENFSSTFSTFAANANTGKVIISKDNGSVIEGTFYFTGVGAAEAQKKITEGKFSAPIN